MCYTMQFTRLDLPFPMQQMNKMEVIFALD